MTWNLPRSIAIIGAGPCGTGFGKALIAEKAFDVVRLFDKRPDFGGLWNYTGDHDSGHDVGDLLQVPSENPHATIIPLKTKDDKYIWKSPVYDSLDTNVPKDLMSFSGTPFPTSLSLFPHREDVNKYLKEYAEPLRKFTRFNSQVIDVRRNKDNSKWSIISRLVAPETKGGMEAGSGEFADVLEEYDAVVIATGNYELPFIPNRDGLADWNKKYPTSITNAKNYRNPNQFINSKDKILVVGNSASANDISYQIATGIDSIVYKLKRSDNPLPGGSSPKIKEVADIAKFDPETKSVHLVDGTILKGIESVIFATGYMYSFPFFKGEGKPLVTDGIRIHGIYNHTLLYNYPNLAISGTPKYVLPTRIAETQGSWVSKVWSGKIKQATFEEMQNWESERASQFKNGGGFHDLVFPQDVHYSNKLNNEILEVNTGLIPFIWSREQISIRGAIKAIKEAYIAYKHDTGKEASTYQELVNSGFLKSFILSDEEMKEKGF